MKSFYDYLARYAEPEARLASQLTEPFDFAVALPLLGEGAVENLLASLSTAAQSLDKTALAILVVNGRADHAETHLPANLALWKKLEARTTALDGNAATRFGAWTPCLGVVALDRFRDERAFAEREGVGHARKIGCDLGLALHAAGRVRSPYLSTTDGDATVAANYFAWRPQARDAALIHPFTHAVERGEAESLLLYEISLRYYVLALHHAKSPYAFHTIGSTMTVHAHAYAAVRGFPKREAAEDFYLLSKLAKVGRVRTDGGEVRLAPRPSDRVPFGTGRSMSRIQGELADGQTYTLYHPTGFEWLAAWLRVGEEVSQSGSLEGARDRLHARAGEIAVALIDEARGWDALETAIRTRKTPADRRRHFHDWFDGFRTLKFIHRARDYSLGTLPFGQALQSAPFLPDRSPRNSVEWLTALRRWEAAVETTPISS